VSSPPPGAKPGDLRAYQDALQRGHQALLAGNARQALTEYEAAAAIATDRPLPHLSAGRALLALGRAADALAAFDRAHALAPTDTGALQGRAEALARLGRPAEAAQVADQINRLVIGTPTSPASGGPAAGEEPDDVLGEAVMSRAEVLMVAAERAWQDRRVDTAVGQWLAAARYHAAAGHIDAALDACQRALLADATDARVHLEMCRLYLVRGWHDHAAERMALLARIVELDGDEELRAELVTLARAHADADPRFGALVERLGEQPPG
jgi:tetratricopeptide (TPR) repeat protein